MLYNPLGHYILYAQYYNVRKEYNGPNVKFSIILPSQTKRTVETTQVSINVDFDQRLWISTESLKSRNTTRWGDTKIG